MRSIVLYIAVSLDGYIADTEGSVNWLGGDGTNPSEPGSYDDFIQTIDTVILGYTTYHQIVTELSPDAWPYEGKESYVITHKKLADSEGIRFTGESPAALLSRLRETQGGDIWICGGAAVIGQALKAGLVDKVTLCVMPTLLGNGVKLFEPGDIERKLTFVSSRVYDGIVDLNYRVRDT